LGNTDVLFRGYRGGITIYLDETVPFTQAMQELGKRIRSAGRFWNGAEVIINVGSRNLTSTEVSGLRSLTERDGLRLRKIVMDFDGDRLVSGTLLSSPGYTGQEEPNMPTLFIKRTLRSGQSIRHNGHVVILGDVNPGAEVMAAGDIVILGWLRGMAHAGALGDERAIVAAFRLQPTQLRIASCVARPPEGEPKPDMPEIASIRDNQIVIDTYLV